MQVRGPLKRNNTQEGTNMQPIDTVRAFFPQPAGDEAKIVQMLQTVLEKIDTKKQGTMIGKKPAVDYEKLVQSMVFPSQMRSEQDVIAHLSDLYEGVGLWSHPQMQVNVVPPPTTLSIAAATLAARYNENAIWDHYGMSAAQSEVMVLGMLADLIGFEPATVGGVFTFGGTACNLYAARIGIEKADPDAKHTGIRDRIHFYASDVSHYSIQSAAIWTGVGLNNLQIIPSDDDNVMDILALEKALHATINSGARIGTIFATMGTTDAFGIDALQEIAALRDTIQKRVPYTIHVHADAVIGWPYLTFSNNSRLHHLPHPLQEEIQSIVSKMIELRYADSVGIDFHKTGWAPYLCSLLLVKDKRDLLLLQKMKKDMPYLYHGAGYQPGVFTLESSRPNYAQKALVNILLFGKEGYEILITHLISMSDYFRAKIANSQDITLLNRHNPAFVTDFRIYPHTKFDESGLRYFDRELHDNIEHTFTQSINEYNQKIAQYMIHKSEQEGTSVISYTDSYKTTKEQRMLVALKSYPMSPFTDTEHMDALLTDIYEAKHYIDTYEYS
jgi:glutamate/tyrosine decarboxylase-like PLP-dependent enzyme